MKTKIFCVSNFGNFFIEFSIFDERLHHKRSGTRKRKHRVESINCTHNDLCDKGDVLVGFPPQPEVLGINDGDFQNHLIRFILNRHIAFENHSLCSLGLYSPTSSVVRFRKFTEMVERIVHG